MDNLIACRPQSFGPYADRAFESMEELGIRFVEIEAPARREVEAVSARLRKHRLEASSVTLPHRCQKLDFFDRVGEAVDAAVALGTRVIFTSQHTGDLPREQVFTLLRLAGDLAARQGVTLVLETHPDLCTNGSTALQTIETIDHPNVLINFDPANIYYYNEGVDAVAELQKVAPYVRAVHLKDSNGGYKEHHFPAIGEGVVDWTGLFAILNFRGLYGPFTLEMEGIAGENLTYEETCDRIRRSLDYLKVKGLMASP